MRPFGGFDHNVQTIRIVTLIERRYPRMTGLNLSWDVLDGLQKRARLRSMTADRAWFLAGLPGFGDPAWAGSFDPHGSAKRRSAGRGSGRRHRLQRPRSRGWPAGRPVRAPATSTPCRSWQPRGTGSPRRSSLPITTWWSRGLARELVGCFVEGAVAEGRRRLDAARPETSDDIRHAGRLLIALPDELVAASGAIKQFLFTRMYRHPILVERRALAKTIVHALASRLLEKPDLLPEKWQDVAHDRRSRAPCAACHRLCGQHDRPVRHGRAPSPF